jgi:hypothetical protein
VPEPEGGAHTAPEETARLLRRSLILELAGLQGTRASTLLKRRQQKYRRMGEYGQPFRESMRREAKILQAAFSATVRAFRRSGPSPAQMPEALPPGEEPVPPVVVQNGKGRRRRRAGSDDA